MFLVFLSNNIINTYTFCIQEAFYKQSKHKHASTMNIFKVLPLLLAAATMILSCTNDSNDNSTNTDDILTNAGIWRVTYYWDKDKDETSNFAGYTFVFEKDGTFKAIKTGVPTTGTWQLNSSGNKLIINTGVTTKPLESLKDNWLIIEKADKRINLKDDNSEELLTFEII